MDAANPTLSSWGRLGSQLDMAEAFSTSGVYRTRRRLAWRETPKRSSLDGRSAGNSVKGEVGGGGAVLVAPLVEEAAIAEGDVVGGLEAEAGGGAVDPFGGAFELGVVADGGFVDDAMAFAVVPLGAPFFVAEGGDEAEREKDLRRERCRRRPRFRFRRGACGVSSPGPVVGQALVGDGPAAGVAADAENLGAGAHLAVGRVVEDVALKAARSLQRESGGLEALGEGGEVGARGI